VFISRWIRGGLGSGASAGGNLHASPTNSGDEPKLFSAILDYRSMFSHEKLEVYRFSVEFLRAVFELIRRVPSGNADVVNQLRRAVMSIPLNIAEGAGKTGESDKKRFYAIARSCSSRMCGAA
jgi:hypothetical protein